MEEVRVLGKKPGKGRKENEIYGLLDPSFYVVLPFPVLEVHDTLRNDRGTQSSDLYAKTKLNSPAIALIESHTQPFPGS